jgi:hypothetical protein
MKKIETEFIKRQLLKFIEDKISETTHQMKTNPELKSWHIDAGYFGGLFDSAAYAFSLVAMVEDDDQRLHEEFQGCSP